MLVWISARSRQNFPDFCHHVHGLEQPTQPQQALQPLLRNCECQEVAGVSPGFGMQWPALDPFFKLTGLHIGAACYFPRGTSYQGNPGTNQH